MFALDFHELLYPVLIPNLLHLQTLSIPHHLLLIFLDDARVSALRVCRRALLALSFERARHLAAPEPHVLVLLQAPRHVLLKLHVVQPPQLLVLLLIPVEQVLQGLFLQRHALHVLDVVQNVEDVRVHFVLHQVLLVKTLLLRLRVVLTYLLAQKFVPTMAIYLWLLGWFTLSMFVSNTVFLFCAFWNEKFFFYSREIFGVSKSAQSSLLFTVISSSDCD